MKKNIYEISGEKFSLLPYGDLTPNQEKKINEMLGIQDNRSETSREIRFDVESKAFLEMILVPENKGAKLDVNDVTYNQIIEIISDYLIEKKNFFDSLKTSFPQLILKKLKLTKDT